MFKKDTEIIDLASNLTTSWIYLDDYKSLIDEVTINLSYSGVTGTLNGTIDVELLFDDNTTEDYSTIGSFTIDSASGRSGIRTSTDCMAIRFKYTKNSVTGGTARMNYIIAGK